jgi:acetoacetate decarboxylase
MYLDDEGPIAGGRELWGFPKKLASPKIAVESDVLVGTLHYGSVLCASATMGYKHRKVDHDAVLKAMQAPNFMIKIIPHVDGTPRICELVRYYLEGHHAEGGLERPRGARACSRMRSPTWRGCRCAKWSPRSTARRI